MRVRFSLGTKLIGSVPKRPGVDISCPSPSDTLEIGWYKSGALRARLGAGELERRGPFGLVYLEATPTEAGEYLALAYCVQGSNRSAAVNLLGAGGSVTITDDGGSRPGTLDSGTDDGTDDDSSRSGARRETGPPAITLWSDRLAYWADEQIRVYLDIDPRRDDRKYTLFVYRERVATGERLYLAPKARSARLWDEVIDQYGRPWAERRARALGRVEKRLVWEGQVPHAGLWHFVAELRSPGTTQVLQSAYAKFVVSQAGAVPLNWRGFEQMVESDLSLTSDRFYILEDRLRVMSGATLTIEAGTVVLAHGPAAEIVIEPGARILALGRREAPVVLTCSAPLGARSPGCWGGLRMFGRAPVGAAQDAAEGTLRALASSGDDPHDSSGVLRHVRVEFAAGGFTVPEEPSAALELNGVGDGTVIDHVQVHASLGDGFSFRGGTAHCSHCVASEARRASLVWERGWQGAAQHLYFQQCADAASAIHGRARRPTVAGAAPTLYNATLVGGYNSGVQECSPGRLPSISPGILLDGEAAVTARNVLVTGFAGFALDGSPASFASGRSSFSHAVLAGSAFRSPFSPQVRGRIEPYVEYVSDDPKLLNVRYAPNPDPRPASGSVALQLGNAEVAPFDSKFSRTAHYVGAFRQHNWLVEWTFFGPERAYEVPLD